MYFSRMTNKYFNRYLHDNINFEKVKINAIVRAYLDPGILDLI